MGPKNFLDEKLAGKLNQDPHLLKSSGIAGKVIGLNIEGSGGGQWTFHFDSSGALKMNLGLPSQNSDCLIEMKDQTFEGLLAGTVNVPMAFLMRKIKIKGDAGLAAQVGMALKQIFLG